MGILLACMALMLTCFSPAFAGATPDGYAAVMVDNLAPMPAAEIDVNVDRAATVERTCAGHCADLYRTLMTTAHSKPTPSGGAATGKVTSYVGPTADSEPDPDIRV